MRILLGVGAAIVLMAAAGGLTSEASTSAASVARPACCYTNPQYSGVCVVQPAKDESCGSIRNYLRRRIPDCRAVTCRPSAPRTMTIAFFDESLS